MNHINELNCFAHYLGENHKNREFVYWRAGSNNYLFLPNKRSSEFLGRQIGGNIWSRFLARQTFRMIPHLNSLRKIIPRMMDVNIKMPDSFIFDLVLIGYRIKIINFDSEIIITIPLDRTDARSSMYVHNEIAARQHLPAEVPTPKIIEIDKSYPYIAETFVDGYPLSNLIHSWDSILSALQSLKTIYRQPPTTIVSINEAVSDLQDAITHKSLSTKVIIRALELLNDLDLPDYLGWSRIHGDLHVGNILQTDAGIQIVDWEDSRIDYACFDFFNLFLKNIGVKMGAKLMADMVNGSGRGGRLSRSYAAHSGQLLWGSNEFPSGLPIFFLLTRVVQRSDSPPGRPLTYLKRVLNKVQ